MLNSDQMNNKVIDGVTDPDSDHDSLAFTSGVDGQSLYIHVERDVNLAWLGQGHYHKDPHFMKFLKHPEAHPRFGIKNQLIWTKNQMGRDVICIPQKAFIWGGD